MYVVFFLLIITGNYIWGELVVPHYRNVFSGVLVVSFFFAKSTRGVLTGKGVLCLFSFLLAALSFHIFWNSNLFPLSIYLSIYLSISITFLFVQGSVYIGYCSSVTIAHGCSSPTKSIGISAVIKFLPAADRDCLHIQWSFHFLTSIFSPTTISCCSSVAFRILRAIHHIIVHPDSILGLL